MEYRVLGKLEVLRDGHAVDLGAFRQRALLALLLTAPNSVFSTDQIIDGLWGADGGIDKQNALWVYVSGLRKALEPRSREALRRARSCSPAHRATSSRRLRRRSTRSASSGWSPRVGHSPTSTRRPRRSCSVRRWRSGGAEPSRTSPTSRSPRPRSPVSRSCGSRRSRRGSMPISSAGMSRELISELETLVRQHPLQERLTGQLMLALYRSARQADALRGVPTAQVTAGRGARHRAVVGAAQARGADRHR